MALLLVSPTLLSGLAFDDYLFVYQTNHPAHDEWAGSFPFDLFRWVDAAHEPRLLDGQGLPWWSYERTSVAFMRPVSSLTHALDHWLWPHSAFGMHLQSLLWFACTLLVAARAYAALNESRFVTVVSARSRRPTDRPKSWSATRCFWSDTVVIVTYDENGGFWDHVAPPAGDRWGPGTRVPTMVISPFATGGVDSTVYDTTAILALIEKWWKVPPLSQRDAAQADLAANAIELK